MDIIKHFIARKQINYDRIIFYVWPLAAATISLILETSYFTSLFLFFGCPIIYLFYRNQKRIKKILLFSLPVFLVMAVVLDYICDITGIWAVASSVFNYRILGQVPIENLIWLISYTIFVVAYYEYFFEFSDRDKNYRPRLKYFHAFFISVFIIFLAVYITNKDWLYIKYFYLKFGIILGLLPTILMLARSPKLFTKFIKTGIYFFYHSLTYEITALYLGWWSFPGREIIGSVVLGRLSFPIEELLFWMTLGAVGLLSFYEFFDDDEK
ncbi:MAG: hypothetical protein WC456_03300 [Patescibacteria group bacterium]